MTINKASYINAANSAIELSEQGIRLGAVGSSPLAELVEASRDYRKEFGTDMPRILTNPAASVFSAASIDDRAQRTESITSNFSELSPQSALLEKYADDIAPFLRSHMSVARNVVRPLVTELSEKLAHYAQTQKPIDPASLFTIRKGSVPEFLKDESFMAGGLESYAGNRVDRSSSTTLLKNSLIENTDPGFLLSAIDQGADRINAMMAKWLSTKDVNFLRNVYLSNFTNVSLGEGYRVIDFYTSGPSSDMDAFTALDIAVIVYMLATRFMTDIQSTKGMSLAEYKTQMREVVDNSASIIWKCLRTIERQSEAKVMVTRVSVSERLVVVDRVLYEAWIADGGSPEVILGMMVSGNVVFAIPAIDEKREQNADAWRSYLSLSEVNGRQELRKRFLEYALSETILGLNDLTEVEKEFNLTSNTHTARAQVEIRKQIDHLAQHALENIDHFALHLIAKGRFYFTSSYLILNEMAEAAKVNPDINPREAALIASVAYLAEYMVSQIALTITS